MKNKKGFTLIELLVVISIIAILAAMLLPVLSQAKNRVRDVVCMGNLRQHGMAMMMYANDFNSWYYWRYDGATKGGYYMPRQLSRDTDATFDIHAVVEQYLPVSAVYLCPWNSRGRQNAPEDIWPMTTSATPGYNGYQFWLYLIYANYASGNNTYYLPDGTVASWDELYPRKINEAGKEDRPLMGDQQTQKGSSSFFWNAHANINGPNVPVSMLSGSSLFQDGRVENFKNGDGFVKSFSRGTALRYWRPGE